MSGTGAFPFDPERLAALGRLSAEINARSAPPPISEQILLDKAGRVLLPVPFHPDSDVEIPQWMPTRAWRSLHTGISLQWAPMVESGGLLLCIRGGAPDGDALRDSVAAFLTPTGLDGLISDLQAIAASLKVHG